VIHGCHEDQDIRRMGGLRKFMPVTFATYAVGMMALSGVPIFFSGFWSKDGILEAAHRASHKGPFYLGVTGALLTAFYMTRQVCFVFFGKNRAGGSEAVAHEHATAEPPHESPRVMTVPLMILAVFAVLLGFIGTPAWPWFQSYLSGASASVEIRELFHGAAFFTMLLSTTIVAIGIGLGWWFYGKSPAQTSDEMDVLEELRPDIFTLLKNKFYVDEFYEMTVIRLNAWFAWFCDSLDYWVWNGAVLAISYLVIGCAWLDRFIDEYVVNLGFDLGCRGVAGGGKLFSWFQNGQVQNYLRVIGVALAALTLVLIWGCRAS
jgi:NADH-quinone oxidoreductase subunit L